MRVYFRRAVKISAGLFCVVIFNVFVGLVWPIATSKKSEKVLRQVDTNNGEVFQPVADILSPFFEGHKSFLRTQRSAKSFSGNTNQRSNLLIDTLKPLQSQEIKRRTSRSPSNLDEKYPSTRPFQKPEKEGNGTHGLSSLSHGRETQLSDVFISVKTSGKFHASRLQPILKTWYLLAREQVQSICTFF